jgi:hypothetical protein
VGHAAQAVPPQSTSLSLWFRTPSSQVAAWQIESTQRSLMQSACTLQVVFGSHFLQSGPPQSLSVSAALRTPSAQVAAAQVPSMQESVTQSVPARHERVSGQGGQAPPQSTSVSVPFFRLSSHTAGWQRSPRQTCERQSALFRQGASAGQPPHEPPQSTDASSPFLTASSQDGGWQTGSAGAAPASGFAGPVIAAHTPLVQWLPSEQRLPLAHGAHAPAQSTSLSPSFSTPSMQLGG